MKRSSKPTTDAGVPPVSPIGSANPSDIADTPIGAVATKLYDTHTAAAYAVTRLQLFGVGLPTDTYDRLFALKSEHEQLCAAREARDGSSLGGEVEPTFDLEGARRWIRVLHAAARARASLVGQAGAAILRKVGVDNSPSDTPDQAHLSVGKLLQALNLMGPTALHLPATFIEDGEALLKHRPMPDSEPVRVASDDRMAARRILALEGALETIFNQVLTHAELLTAITGQQVPGVDFGYPPAPAECNEAAGDIRPTQTRRR